jgi:hypothetical protein
MLESIEISQFINQSPQKVWEALQFLNFSSNGGLREIFSPILAINLL